MARGMGFDGASMASGRCSGTGVSSPPCSEGRNASGRTSVGIVTAKACCRSTRETVSPISTDGTGRLLFAMELVVSFEGGLACAASRSPRAAQPEIVRQARRMVDTADRRIGTRTQNTIDGGSAPFGSHRIQVLMEIYQKSLNPSFLALKNRTRGVIICATAQYRRPMTFLKHCYLWRLSPNV